MILWVCLIALALLALGRSGWRGLLRLAAPGAGVLLAWQGFVAVARVETASVFYPLSLGLFLDRLHLWDEIGGAMVKLTFNPGDWGLLWILFPVAAIFGLWAHRSRRSLLLVGAVVAPLPFFVLLYFFTKWEPVTLHVQSSFSRLLLPLSLPAIVLIAWMTALLIFPASREV
jgi:hypothetical protein